MGGKDEAAYYLKLVLTSRLAGAAKFIEYFFIFRSCGARTYCWPQTCLLFLGGGGTFRNVRSLFGFVEGVFRVVVETIVE